MKKNIYIKVLIILTAATFYACGSPSSGESGYSYYTPEEVNQFLNDIHSVYPSITEIETVGNSVENRPIKALVISGSPSVLQMEPRIRLSGGIHGNEKITTEILISFIDYLVSGYGTDTEITSMINSRYIVIIPLINPDGNLSYTRYNKNGVDLNRNFSREWAAGTDHGLCAFSEPESSAIRDFSLNKRFTASITLHSGSVIVNMPFDYIAESAGGAPLENDLVKEFGLCYTEAGTFLDNPDILNTSEVYHGTINGGDWYIINGSMQDWSYLDSGCLDYTVEISRSFSPSDPADVEAAYNYNRDSLVAFIKKSGYGVYGQVTDGTNPLADVKITIPEGDLVIETDSEGYYHRLLLPGTYDLTFSKDGVTTTVNSIIVTDTDTGVLKNVILN